MDHYKKKEIEPIIYIKANGLDFFEGNIIKYVTRHRDKGKSDDIKKAIDYAIYILKYQYNYTDEEIEKTFKNKDK